MQAFGENAIPIHPICHSQVWRLDPVGNLLYPIRPGNGGPNGLCTAAMSTLNTNLTFNGCCQSMEGYTKSRHQKSSMEHLARLRPNCIGYLNDVHKRKVNTGPGRTAYEDKVPGMSAEFKRNVDRKRTKLIERAVHEIAHIAVIDDRTVEDIMSRWDILPDEVGRALSRGYYVFPEYQVMARDGIYAIL